MTGVLTVNPIKAKLNENHDLFGKQDPYCIFHLGGQQIKSKVCRNGGKRPSWNDSLLIKRRYEPVLYIEIKDKDVFSDDLIGVSQIDLNKIPAQKANSQWYPIYNKKKAAGEILIEVVYTPDEPVAPQSSASTKNVDNKATQASKNVEQEVEDPLKKSAYLAEHITPITNSVNPVLHIENQVKPLYPTLNEPSSNNRQPNHQQPGPQQTNGQSPSNQPPSNQQTNYQQPNYQQQQQQPGYQRPGYQQPSRQQMTNQSPSNQSPSHQQTNYQQPPYQQQQQQPGYQQQPMYQQPGYQQPVRQDQYYQQPGYGQPNFNQGGVWQPNVQPGVWQPNNRQSYPMQPNFGYNPCTQGAQHQLP